MLIWKEIEVSNLQEIQLKEPGPQDKAVFYSLELKTRKEPQSGKVVFLRMSNKQLH